MVNHDCRSGRVLFLSNCILNANNKVLDFARYPGMFSEILKVLDEYGLGVQQMPCPETLYLGNQRWWHTSNLYDNAGFRRFCRGIAAQTADYIENYLKVGFEVVGILACNGSPTCGYTLTSFSEDWGGKPEERPWRMVEGPGVYTQELIAECKARGLETPEICGLTMDDLTRTNEEVVGEFREFLERKIKKEE